MSLHLSFEKPGQVVSVGEPRALNIAISVPNSELSPPVKKAVLTPDNSSPMMQPRLHTSDGGAYLSQSSKALGHYALPCNSATIFGKSSAGDKCQHKAQSQAASVRTERIRHYTPQKDLRRSILNSANPCGKPRHARCWGIPGRP
jgi:hypothetical protein